jgi:hypothetical protein
VNLRHPAAMGFDLIWSVARAYFAVVAEEPLSKVQRIIGAMVKQHGRDTVLLALDTTIRAKPVIPLVYFLGVCNGDNQQSEPSAWRPSSPKRRQAAGIVVETPAQRARRRIEARRIAEGQS